MRQLFLPACVCLVTWSGATTAEPNLSLANFTGASAAPKSAPKRMAAGAARPELLADAAVLEVPRVPDTAADLAIEIPAPSGDSGSPAQAPPAAKHVVARSREEICDTLAEAAHHNNLPIPFFIRLLFQESRFDPSIVSRAGAQGIAQFMPETAADVGLKNPFDPLQAIPASARLLRNLLTQFGNLGLAAAAYNAGPKRIQDWLQNKGKSKLPEETQGYVKTITGRPVETWTAAAARHPEQRLPRHAPCQDRAGLYAWNGPRGVPLPAPAPSRATVTAAAKSARPSGSHHGKASVKTAATQLAARRHAHRHKSEKVAQR